MALDIKIPTVGESITEVTIASWTKNDGDYVELDEMICEIESDKATFELNAEAAGTLHILVEEGGTVSIGDKIASIDTDAKAGAKPEKKEESKEDKAPKADTSANNNGREEKAATYADHHPSPAAQKILNEKGVKPEDVQGSGRDGRITKEDASSAEARKEAPSSPKEEKQEAPQAAPGARTTRREKMTSLRKTIAKRLVEAKNTTAMLTTFNEVDMSAVMELRKKYKEAFKEKHQIGLGFMSFFTAAVCAALKEYPAVNGMVDEGEIIFHDYMDIGIAVSTPRGLVVPVIRNAESLSLAGVEKKIMELALKARDNKISIEEMTGGTFTITNGGIFGSMLSTPILNLPQSAILGMHNIVERPVVVNGEIVIRPIMYLALSYDHRIVDGRESVSFLKMVKELLEDPSRLLLGI